MAEAFPPWAQRRSGGVVWGEQSALQLVLVLHGHNHPWYSSDSVAKLNRHQWIKRESTLGGEVI